MGEVEADPGPIRAIFWFSRECAGIFFELTSVFGDSIEACEAGQLQVLGRCPSLCCWKAVDPRLEYLYMEWLVQQSVRMQFLVPKTAANRASGHGLLWGVRNCSNIVRLGCKQLVRRKQHGEAFTRIVGLSSVVTSCITQSDCDFRLRTYRLRKGHALQTVGFSKH